MAREWPRQPEKPMTLIQKIEVTIIAAPLVWGYVQMIQGAARWVMTLFSAA